MGAPSGQAHNHTYARDLIPQALAVIYLSAFLLNFGLHFNGYPQTLAQSRGPSSSALGPFSEIIRPSGIPSLCVVSCCILPKDLLGMCPHSESFDEVTWPF